VATTLAGARSARSAPGDPATPLEAAAAPRGCGPNAVKKASRQEATRCAEAAKKRLFQSERALNEVVRDRRFLTAQIREYKRLRIRLADQRQALRQIWGATAREHFMTGSPTSVASIVSTSDANDLLEKLVTSQYLAERDHDRLRDLNGLERASEVASDALSRSERKLATLEAQLRAKLGQAQKLSNDWLKTLEVLRTRNITIPRDTGGVVGGGGGGLCALAGVPDAARQIIMKESGGNPYADNPSSTAFGLGQLLLDNRIRLMGDDYASTDCGKQYAAFKQYTLSRYGTFENAWAFWSAHHYY